MDHIKVARWTYYTGNFQKQTFIECDRPDKRRVSYESRRPWCDCASDRRRQSDKVLDDK
jgi:hypothetical protein